MFYSLSRVVWGGLLGALFGFILPYLLFLYFDTCGLDIRFFSAKVYFVEFHEDLFYPALYAVLGSWFWLIFRIVVYRFRSQPYYTKDSFYDLEEFYHSKATLSPIIAPIMMMPFLIILISHLVLPYLDISYKPVRSTYFMSSTYYTGGWRAVIKDAVMWTGLVFIVLWSFVFHALVRYSNYERLAVLAFSSYFSFAAAHVYLITLFYDSFFWFLSYF